MKVFLSVVKIVFLDRSSFKFAIGVWLGLSFSIAVILCTVGLMDGFVSTLKSGLKKSNGDIYFYSRDGFFDLDKEIVQTLKDLKIKDFSPHIQTEAFVVSEDQSRGVSIRGIEPESFKNVTGLGLDLKEGDVAIGKELAHHLKLKKGDFIVLALAKGNEGISSLPLLKRFQVAFVVNHGIYQKDLRFVYTQLKELKSLLSVKEKVNVVALNIPGDYGVDLLEHSDKVKAIQFELEDHLGLDYRIKPYWYDFSTLLEAVEIEKLTIGLVLQIIVVISIFNVLAFVVLINEKRSRELFLLRALGMAQKQIVKAWIFLVILLWISSCVLSFGFVALFDWSLQNLSLFELPGDIYTLGRLSLDLSIREVSIVFAISLIWLLFISLIGLFRARHKSILHGLREEFV